MLAERAEALGYRPDAGLVVLPCELVEANGDRLGQIVRRHAERWGLGDRFLDWLDGSVTFCNTLVDRIVPGTPDDPSDLYERLGYTDALLTVAEPYRLWAVEGDAGFAERFPLAGLDGVVVTDDLRPYRERKVRVLNGGHTAAVPAALLCGLGTVREAVEDETVGPFVRRVVLDEIVPSLDLDAEAFAREVLDRFANPFVRHALLDITAQQTTKLGVRVVPSVLGYAEKRGEAPPLLAFGVAAFLASTRPGALPEGRPGDDAESAWRARWAGVGEGNAALRRFARGRRLDGLGAGPPGRGRVRRPRGRRARRHPARRVPFRTSVSPRRPRPRVGVLPLCTPGAPFCEPDLEGLPPMTREDILEAVLDSGAVAVVRVADSEQLVRVAEAIAEGGVTAIEVTMTTPHALDVIESVSRQLGEAVTVGVGSVLDAETARRAVDAGARYVVSPVFKREIIDEAHRLGVPAMPGCFTPTEILEATEAGADVVKVFPADVLGIPFFKGVLAPMPHLRMMPTGGVSLTNAGDWLRAGAVAVGVGSALLDKEAIATGDWHRLTERARTLRQSVESGRPQPVSP